MAWGEMACPGWPAGAARHGHARSAPAFLAVRGVSAHRVLRHRRRRRRSVRIPASQPAAGSLTLCTLSCRKAQRRLQQALCWHDRSKDKDMVWRPVESRRKHREYPWTLGSMQVYASYRYRRDLVEAVKAAGALTRTRPLVVRRKLLPSAPLRLGSTRRNPFEDTELMLVLPSQDAELVLRWADAGRGQHKAVEMDEVMLCFHPNRLLQSVLPVDNSFVMLHCAVVERSHMHACRSPCGNPSPGSSPSETSAAQRYRFACPALPSSSPCPGVDRLQLVAPSAHPLMKCFCCAGSEGGGGAAGGLGRGGDPQPAGVGEAHPATGAPRVLPRVRHQIHLRRALQQRRRAAAEQTPGYCRRHWCACLHASMTNCSKRPR